MAAVLEGHPIRIGVTIYDYQIYLYCEKCKKNICEPLVASDDPSGRPEFHDILIEVVSHRVQFAKT